MIVIAAAVGVVCECVDDRDIITCFGLFGGPDRSPYCARRCDLPRPTVREIGRLSAGCCGASKVSGVAGVRARVRVCVCVCVCVCICEHVSTARVRGCGVCVGFCVKDDQWAHVCDHHPGPEHYHHWSPREQIQGQQ